MEMNSHQNTPTNQAVANTPPSAAARRQGVPGRTSQASAAKDSHCSPPCGAPLPGNASDAACASPASSASAQCQRAARGALMATDVDGAVTGASAGADAVANAISPPAGYRRG